LKNLGKALKYAFGGGTAGEKKREKGQVSSFSSLTTELAATIGTGNIVGVTTAMVLGGPGALVWMMLSAVIGMATKLVESTLAVKYRSKNDMGETVGGPMYTMVRGLQNKRGGRILAFCFALFAVLASFGMGNMTQSNSIALAIKSTFEVPEAKTGLLLTIITILVVLGGIKSIAKVTNIVVPIMGIFYMAGTVCVILMHIDKIPEGLFLMLTAAFTPGAACGGIAGTLTADMFSAIRFGVSRGVFSNEAGLGAAGISAACADTKDYIKQGYISMTGVFLDTIVICSATGLALMCSGVLGKTGANGELLTGIELTIAVFETVFGRFGAWFVSICITLFAFATIIGWAYQGEKSFEFLVKRSKYCVYYRFIYGLVVFVGTVCSLDVVWNFSDICNGLMAVPNLICVILLSKKACREILDYRLH
ncbi:MAG: alanine:cation symporter family protein, partial [Lachnospiraceae bacterium]|nr:alanine:cation symporter family protein [Lachnospiraceae bacterium]